MQVCWRSNFPEKKTKRNRLERIKQMILKIGNKEIKVERESVLTKLTINNRNSVQHVYMDKAETAALVAGLKAEAPKD